MNLHPWVLAACCGLMSSSAIACLDAVEDDIDLSRTFGDPNIEPGDVLHVEDDPMLAGNVVQFSTSVAYLRGYADGQEIRYWNVDGPNADFVIPIYEVVGPDGLISRPIIDVLPGTTAYSPWWRRVVVRTTASYNGERIWSRAAIDAGVRLGILEAPEDTQDVVNIPVILRNARIPVDESTTVEPTWGWYRNRRVSWVAFSERTPVEIGTLRMPKFPVYIIQRITEREPIYEFVTGRDQNDDGDLDDTNNIFSAGNGRPRYSPLWFVTFLRTTGDYPSIDTQQAPGLTSEDQFVNANGEITSTLVAPSGLNAMPDVLVNCPIQRIRGSL